VAAAGGGARAGCGRVSRRTRRWGGCLVGRRSRLRGRRGGEGRREAGRLAVVRRGAGRGGAGGGDGEVALRRVCLYFEGNSVQIWKGMRRILSDAF